VNAGLSASRRSWRNQQMESGRDIGFLSAARDAAYQCKRLPFLCRIWFSDFAIQFLSKSRHGGQLSSPDTALPGVK
ncbi:MAG: hypothetical protein VYB64_04820, partial [Pseudomonadota bacterium]|nr:hypothetical protein [Pseudomonadota bacterium]